MTEQFLPGNPAAFNARALQRLCDKGGRIVIDVPGVYELDRRSHFLPYGGGLCTAHKLRHREQPDPIKGAALSGAFLSGDEDPAFRDDFFRWGSRASALHGKAFGVTLHSGEPFSGRCAPEDRRKGAGHKLGPFT